MGEPLKTYDMLYRAFYDVKAGREGAKKQLLRSTSAYVASAILTSIAAAVMDATRDDDRDKTWTEKYKASVWENFKDNINMLQNIPYLKDAISIAKGESIARTDMSAFQDLYYGFRKVEQLKKDESQYTPQYVALYTLQTMSKATSIPIKTLTRDTFSIIDSVLQGIGGETDYRWIQQKYDISQKKNLGMYVGMILKAESQGEKDLSVTIYNDLIDAGFDNKTVNQRIKKELKKAIKEDPLLEKFVDAKMSSNTKEAEKIYQELLSTGYNSDLVIAVAKSAVDKGSNESDATYERIGQLDSILTDDGSLYDNSDMIRAINEEKWNDVDTIINDIYENKKAASKKTKESEKAKDAQGKIKSALTAAYKKEYIAADSKGKQAIRGKLLRIKVNGKKLYDSSSFKDWK